MATDTTSETQTRPTPTSGSPRRTWWKIGVLVLGVLAIVATALAIIPASRHSPSLEPGLTHTITRGDLLVTVTEQGTLESSNNTEIKCKVRGDSTIISVIETGTIAKPGDVLLKVDTLFIEEEISGRTKFAHLARSGVARAEADVTHAELAIKEYIKGQYVSALATLQKDLAIAESKILSTKNMLGYAKMMAASRYKNELDVEENEFAVSQAVLDLRLIKLRIAVLEHVTKKEEMAALNGQLNVAKANYEAEKERALAEEQRLLRAQQELTYCVVKAERSGIVIYPTGESWKEVPTIEEGATVHKDQVLLLMPDLTKMQVKVGVHESIVDRVKPGLPAKVTLPSRTLDGDVVSVAPVAKPAGWWSGNVVKYDTIVKLPSVEGLKPGMSVEVEIIMARHENVLMIPTSAVMETNDGHACWVQRNAKPERRNIELGDGSEMFLIVESGLEEGEQVVLDPLAHVEEAQNEAAAMLDNSTSTKPTPSEY